MNWVSQLIARAYDYLLSIEGIKGIVLLLFILSLLLLILENVFGLHLQLLHVYEAFFDTAKIKNVLLTSVHLDHFLSIAFF